MVPRPDMVTVESDVTVAQALEQALAAGYSRIPVEGDDGIDDIIGIAYAKDLVRAERIGKANQMVRDNKRPSKFVPESKEVSDLLREMQEEKFHMAIVVDEYGGTAGIVTLEDLVEELVGEIRDEYDREEGPKRLLGGQLEVDGLLNLDEFAEQTGIVLPEGPYETVAGFVLATLGQLPTDHEKVEVAGHVLTVLQMDGRRIARVRVDPVGQPAEPAAPVPTLAPAPAAAPSSTPATPASPVGKGQAQGN
jgi:putative hemolysin